MWVRSGDVGLPPLLGNEKSYRRSAGVTTRFFRAFQIFAMQNLHGSAKGAKEKVKQAQRAHSIMKNKKTKTNTQEELMYVYVYS